jgi:hypothetical protein
MCLRARKPDAIMNQQTPQTPYRVTVMTDSR